MEDSFRVRVDKVFGNLGGSAVSSVGVSPSLWSLTDDEIEKREWNRNKEVAEDGEEEGLETEPSVVRNRLEAEIKELCDDEEEDEEEEEEEEDGDEIEGEEKKRRPNCIGGAEASVDEYLDVQSNIGRDCTLDHEEEEDEYDKVAVGMEQTGDRLYMKNVKYADYSVDEANGYGELPNTFRDVVRDPRANHSAAKNRLKEDAEAAGDFGTLQLSDTYVAANPETKDITKGGSNVDIPRPILKKRDNPEARSHKRVRFMFDPKSSTHEDQLSPGESDMASEAPARNDSAEPEQASDISQYSAVVPDYLKNPSKYTRYTFDSSDDMDEESNRKAYMELFQFLRKRNTDTSMEDPAGEIPKSVVFTPKKKPDHDPMAKRENNTKENLGNRSWSVGITAEENQDSEVSVMEEDEPGPTADAVRSSRKPGRQYRSRTSTDIKDNLD